MDFTPAPKSELRRDVEVKYERKSQPEKGGMRPPPTIPLYEFESDTAHLLAWETLPEEETLMEDSLTADSGEGKDSPTLMDSMNGLNASDMQPVLSALNELPPGDALVAQASVSAVRTGIPLPGTVFPSPISSAAATEHHLHVPGDVLQSPSMPNATVLGLNTPFTGTLHAALSCPASPSYTSSESSPFMFSMPTDKEGEVLSYKFQVENFFSDAFLELDGLGILSSPSSTAAPSLASSSPSSSECPTFQGDADDSVHGFRVEDFLADDSADVSFQPCRVTPDAPWQTTLLLEPQPLYLECPHQMTKHLTIDMPGDRSTGGLADEVQFKARALCTSAPCQRWQQQGSEFPPHHHPASKRRLLASGGVLESFRTCIPACDGPGLVPAGTLTTDTGTAPPAQPAVFHTMAKAPKWPETSGIDGCVAPPLPNDTPSAATASATDPGPAVSPLLSTTASHATHPAQESTSHPAHSILRKRRKLPAKLLRLHIPPEKNITTAGASQRSTDEGAMTGTVTARIPHCDCSCSDPTNGSGTDGSSQGSPLLGCARDACNNAQPLAISTEDCTCADVAASDRRLNLVPGFEDPCPCCGFVETAFSSKIESTDLPVKRALFPVPGHPGISCEANEELNAPRWKVPLSDNRNLLGNELDLSRPGNTCSIQSGALNLVDSAGAAAAPYKPGGWTAFLMEAQVLPGGVISPALPASALLAQTSALESIPGSLRSSRLLHLPLSAQVMTKHQNFTSATSTWTATKQHYPKLALPRMKSGNQCRN